MQASRANGIVLYKLAASPYFTSKRINIWCVLFPVFMIHFSNVIYQLMIRDEAKSKVLH